MADEVEDDNEENVEEDDEEDAADSADCEVGSMFDGTNAMCCSVRLFFACLSFSFGCTSRYLPRYNLRGSTYLSKPKELIAHKMSSPFTVFR